MPESESNKFCRVMKNAAGSTAPGANFTVVRGRRADRSESDQLDTESSPSDTERVERDAIRQRIHDVTKNMSKEGRFQWDPINRRIRLANGREPKQPTLEITCSEMNVD